MRKFRRVDEFYDPDDYVDKCLWNISEFIPAEYRNIAVKVYYGLNKTSPQTESQNVARKQRGESGYDRASVGGANVFRPVVPSTVKHQRQNEIHDYSLSIIRRHTLFFDTNIHGSDPSNLFNACCALAKRYLCVMSLYL